MRFFIGVSRLAKHPSMTISDLHLRKTPSPSQIKSQRDILETNEPTRCLNLQFCARRIIAELRLHKTSEEEFFAVILPRLSERYDSSGGDVKRSFSLVPPLTQSTTSPCKPFLTSSPYSPRKNSWYINSWYRKNYPLLKNQLFLHQPFVWRPVFFRLRRTS